MSLRIEIILPDDYVSSEDLDRHLNALGFARGLAASTALTTSTVQTAVAEANTADAPKPTATRKRTSSKKDEPVQQAVEETEETQAQDAADEAEEAEAEREPEAPLTVDDVKQAVGLYVTKFGMPAVQEDGPKLFESLLGTPPAGERFWKMTILPTDQPTLAKIIAAWKAAAAADKRHGA